MVRLAAVPFEHGIGCEGDGDAQRRPLCLYLFVLQAATHSLAQSPRLLLPTPAGKGEVTFADGSRYDGSLRDGLREGRGTYFFLHGQQYSGRFSSDEIEGGAPGTVLMPHTVPLSADEWMIPVHVGADVSKLHAKAGFDKRGQ